jgi:hypothetical protein
MEYINAIEETNFDTDTVQVNLPAIIAQPVAVNSAFIVANTVEGDLQTIKDHHTIPAFSRDNEPLISHADFITTTYSVVEEYFEGQRLLQPAIRLSHEVKGRIPSAKDKPANQLEEWEKTIYYQRMMFCIEVPGITDIIDGNTLSLTIGGVKSYTLDNLYSKKGSDEHFKLFVGFKNRVCTNLSVWSDGLVNDLKVTNLGQLKACIRSLLEGYNQNLHLYHLKKFAEHSITERQFAHLIGRCRMYNHLPADMRAEIPAILFGEQQMNVVVKDYYKDNSFCRDGNGNINLWKLHNLFTSTNKSSYIDSFLDRSVSAYNFVEQIRWGLEGRSSNWYLS